MQPKTQRAWLRSNTAYHSGRLAAAVLCIMVLVAPVVTFIHWFALERDEQARVAPGQFGSLVTAGVLVFVGAIVLWEIVNAIFDMADAALLSSTQSTQTRARSPEVLTHGESLPGARK